MSDESKPQQSTPYYGLLPALESVELAKTLLQIFNNPQVRLGIDLITYDHIDLNLESAYFDEKYRERRREFGLQEGKNPFYEIPVLTVEESDCIDIDSKDVYVALIKDKVEVWKESIEFYYGKVKSNFTFRFQTIIISAIDSLLLSIITICELNNLALKTSLLKNMISIFTRDTYTMKAVWERSKDLQIYESLLKCVRVHHPDFTPGELKTEKVFKAFLLKLRDQRREEYETESCDEGDDAEEGEDEDS